MYTTQKINPNVQATAKRFMDLLFGPGSKDVREIRAVKTRTGTISGYFDNASDAGTAAAWIDSDGVPAVYVTLNPVLPDLMARAFNKAIPYAKATSSDRDVTKLRRFLIDFDPRRPSGISATDAEVKAVYDLAMQVKNDLTALGWQEPIFVCSGNGCHLIYGFDMSNTPENVQLFRLALVALDKKYSNDQVSVDLTTFNPARITKVAGTWARKGESTPERPHRVSWIVSAPNLLFDNFAVRLRNLIQDAGLTVEKPKVAGTVGTSDTHESWLDLIQEDQAISWNGEGKKWELSDLLAYLDLHKIEYKEPVPYGADAVKVVLDHCPFDESHSGNDAAVFVYESGARDFKCFHASCFENRWRQFRDHFEGTERHERKQAFEQNAVAIKQGRLLNPKTPLKSTEHLVHDLWTVDGCTTIMNRLGTWHVWDGTRYAMVREERIRARIQRWLAQQTQIIKTKEQQESIVSDKKVVKMVESEQVVPFQVNTFMIDEIFELLRNETGYDRDFPYYDGPDMSFPEPGRVIAVQNGLIFEDRYQERRNDYFQPHTPYWRSEDCKPYDYDPEAKCDRFLNYLEVAHANDPDAIQALQEWAGYCLTQDNSLEVMMAIEGGPGTGKTTYANVLEDLVGADNVCAPSLTSLGTDFGASVMRGKSVAIMGDTNSGGNMKRTLEVIKGVTGNSPVSVNIKHKDEIKMRLTTRFLMVINEIPRFNDPSHALERRIKAVTFKHKFVNNPNFKRDTDFGKKLKTEMSGIFNWGLEGLRSLRANGDIIQPDSGREFIRILLADASVTSIFIGDCCVKGAEEKIACDVLYRAYLKWCEDEQYIGSADANPSTFGKKLRANDGNIAVKQATGGKRYYHGIALNLASKGLVVSCPR